MEDSSEKTTGYVGKGAGETYHDWLCVEHPVDAASCVRNDPCVVKLQLPGINRDTPRPRKCLIRVPATVHTSADLSRRVRVGELKGMDFAGVPLGLGLKGMGLAGVR